MKKIFLIALVATALTTSCSNDETIEMPTTTAIRFDNAFVDKTTRATDLTTSNLADFGVYGFVEKPAGTVFSNEQVTKTGSTWTYDNIQYWTAGKSYWFSAIAPAMSAAWDYYPVTAEAGSYDGGGRISFNNEMAAAKQDLLYAWSGEIKTSDPLSTAPAAVEFTFQHLLSRVKFAFTNGFLNENTKLEVSNIKITDANRGGSIDMNVATPSWNISSNTFSIPFGGITDAIARNTKKESTHMFLIPANQAYTLTFTVKWIQGNLAVGTYDHTVTLPTVNMKPGSSYVFNATLDHENTTGTTLYPIEFDVTEVEGWQDFDGVGIS